MLAARLRGWNSDHVRWCSESEGIMRRHLSAYVLMMPRFEEVGGMRKRFAAQRLPLSDIVVRGALGLIETSDVWRAALKAKDLARDIDDWVRWFFESCTAEFKQNDWIGDDPVEMLRSPSASASWGKALRSGSANPELIASLPASCLLPERGTAAGEQPSGTSS